MNKCRAPKPPQKRFVTQAGELSSLWLMIGIFSYLTEFSSFYQYICKLTKIFGKCGGFAKLYIRSRSVWMAWDYALGQWD